MPTCHVGRFSWASQSGTRVFNTEIARVNKRRPQSKSSTGRVYVDMDQTVRKFKIHAHHATSKNKVNRHLKREKVFYPCRYKLFI